MQSENKSYEIDSTFETCSLYINTPLKESKAMTTRAGDVILRDSAK